MESIMRVLIQRVKSASVTVDKECVGNIEQGLLIFLGIHQDDTQTEADWLLNKCLKLRIFDNNQGQFDKSLLDISGELLIVSQFTLYGNCDKGRRPSFIDSAHPSISKPLYDYFVKQAKTFKLKVATGVFGANMLVDIKNDGPVTMIIERNRQ